MIKDNLPECMLRQIQETSLTWSLLSRSVNILSHKFLPFSYSKSFLYTSLVFLSIFRIIRVPWLTMQFFFYLSLLCEFSPLIFEHSCFLLLNRRQERLLQNIKIWVHVPDVCTHTQRTLTELATQNTIGRAPTLAAVPWTPHIKQQSPAPLFQLITTEVQTHTQPHSVDSQIHTESWVPQISTQPLSPSNAHGWTLGTFPNMQVSSCLPTSPAWCSLAKRCMHLHTCLTLMLHPHSHRSLNH